jgi:hypothetical protein
LFLLSKSQSAAGRNVKSIAAIVFAPDRTCHYLPAQMIPLRDFPVLCVALALLVGRGVLAQEPPAENRYDILGKMLAPIASVLLVGGKSGDQALSMRLEVREVTGRLPKEFSGATLEAAVQFPDKVRLSAPVLGENVIVCRNGPIVWAIPGEKVEFLLAQFKDKLPAPTSKANTPLFLPITAQQAIFLPAVFTLDDGKAFEDVNGVACRVISGGLMPELAKATKADDFRATIWVAAGHVPRQIRVERKDFSITVGIEDLTYSPALPPAMWLPPSGSTDIFKTNASVLEQVLFVVMNSIQAPARGE